MIIKSMTRKHASFSQLIDYIERGMDRNNTFSVRFNTYSRDSEELKAEFSENAERLRFRKNGVYLYHEVISIKRTHRISEDQQKEALQKIVMEYLRRRASRQLAYAVLHEDKKDNLHFHLVISANNAGESQRKRLSKSDFSSIQTQLEKWVLETFPELDQQAVFAPNQSEAEKQEKQRKAHISNDGAELKRRGGKTTQKDSMKETIEGIFSTATNGQHFADLMEKASLKLYQRGKNYGVTDQSGTKYRFSTLGLAESWDDLDQRMMEAMKTTKQQTTNHEPQKDRQQTTQDTAETVLGQSETPRETATKARQEAKNEEQPVEAKTPEDTSQDTTKTAEKQHQDTPAPDPIAEEAERRRLEMEAIRAKRASTKTSHKQKQ